MIRIRRNTAACLITAVTALSCLATVPEKKAAPQAAALAYTHTQRSLQPGEVVLFRARSANTLRRLQVSAFGHEYYGFQENAGPDWTCLVGIDRDCKPGRYEIRIAATSPDGRVLTVSGALTVAPKKFPTRKLTVEEKYVTPPANVEERIKREQEKVAAVFAATTQERYWHGAFLRPVPGEVISAFGKQTVYNGQPRSSHSGADFRGAEGIPIKAPNAGRVVLAEDLYFSGNTVILDHGLGLYSYLGHMSAISVKEGAIVRAGDIVGKVGATGRVTGPHLHWTVRLSECRVDPVSLLDMLGSRKEIVK
jgi:biotin carboxyl carrier protein